MLGDAVGFLFVLISRLVDGQLGLNSWPRRGEAAQHCLIADVAVERSERMYVGTAGSVAVSHGGVQWMQRYFTFHLGRGGTNFGRLRFHACGLGRRHRPAPCLWSGFEFSDYTSTFPN